MCCATAFVIIYLIRKEELKGFNKYNYAFSISEIQGNCCTMKTFFCLTKLINNCYRNISTVRIMRREIQSVSKGSDICNIRIKMSTNILGRTNLTEIVQIVENVRITE